MVRLSETGKLRLGDSRRFKIWKKISSHNNIEISTELMAKLNEIFLFRKAPLRVIQNMLLQHEQKMMQEMRQIIIQDVLQDYKQDVKLCSTLVESMLKEIREGERNTLDRKLLFQDLLFHHCRCKEIEQKKTPKTIMLTSYHYNDGIPLVQNNIIFPVQTGAALTDFRFGCETDIQNGISEKMIFMRS